MTAPPPLAGIATFRSLHQAALDARRGKHLSRHSAAFFVDLETELFSLQRELLSGSWRPGPFRSFVVTDPKPRLISAAPFRDRVVHHALCAVMGPRLEHVASDASFACRLGRGTTSALARAREYARETPYGAWFLKLDIRRYFETMNQELLVSELSAHLPEPGLLDVVRRIIDAGAPGSVLGKGVPIGNLTSQHFANFYLTAFDHWCRETLPHLAYVRYMDDMLFFGPDRDAIIKAQPLIVNRLEVDRKLEVKHEVTRRGPMYSGLPFLGFRIWPDHIRLDRHRKRRLGRHLRRISRHLRGRLSEETASSSVMSLLGWTSLGEAEPLVRNILSVSNFPHLEPGSQAHRRQPRQPWR